MLFYFLNRYVQISTASFKVQSVLCYIRPTDKDPKEEGGGRQTYGVLKLVFGSFRFCSFLLTEGSILDSFYKNLGCNVDKKKAQRGFDYSTVVAPDWLSTLLKPRYLKL